LHAVFIVPPWIRLYERNSFSTARWQENSGETAL
jgi:hypothetical protein